MVKTLFLVALVLYAYTLRGQDLDYAKEVVGILASPEMKGRGYADDGNKLAANYIKTQFEQIGLKPINGDYYQRFSINVNTFPGKLKLVLDDHKLIPGVDYLVDPFSPPLKGKFDVEWVESRDLLDNSKLRSAISNSKGKMLIIDQRNYTPELKEEKQKIDEIKGFLKYSPQVLSAGTIILTSEKLVWGTSTQQAQKTSFTVNSVEDLAKLSSVKVDVDASLIRYETRNVIGYIEGTECPDSFLVVTAHYDHLGAMGNKTFFPGANDNASGVAMLLTLAKHFKQNPQKYSIVFVALAAEEVGLIGAKFFVEHPLVDLKMIVFLINFDLAGTGDEGIKVVNGSVFKAHFDTLSGINQKNEYLKSVQARGAACNGDHCMFYEKGVPCFNIYTLGGIQAYHDIYDKSETLPLNEFADYSKLMIGYLESL